MQSKVYKKINANYVGETIKLEENPENIHETNNK